jgi:hypothetical protein
LGGNVVLFGEHVVTDSGTVGVLQVCVEVDFDDAVADCLGVFLFGGAAPAVEDQEPNGVLEPQCRDIGGRIQRFLVFALKLFAGVLLVFVEEFGVETDVAGFVDTVDVSETSGDGKVGSDFGEIAVYIPDILWLGIQRGIINASIIDTYPSIPYGSCLG